jgi:hypothetical protein
MAAVRLSQLQKHILRWLAADHQRTNGVMTSSHPELVHALQRDKGNISHSLRTVEHHGFLIIGRSSGGQAESLMLTRKGKNEPLSWQKVVIKRQAQWKQWVAL